jgi:hypothetical protein
MRKYKNVYMTQFYRDVDIVADTSIRVETADAYAAVESLMGSLFTKYPGVEIGEDITGKGDAQVVKELSNNFLKTARQQIENAARMALIYTHSFLKLAPRESTTVLGKVALRAIPPWQVILDRDAAAWEDSRFIGHVYYISVDEANEKFGNKKWHGVAQKDYFTDFERNTDRSYKSYGDTSGGDLPNEYLYLEIVEIYDFLNDELLFWTGQWKNGEELLSRDKIPVTTFDDRPLSNIVPFYFSRTPDRPMEGYSTLGRVYDQCHPLPGQERRGLPTGPGAEDHPRGRTIPRSQGSPPPDVHRRRANAEKHGDHAQPARQASDRFLPQRPSVMRIALVSPYDFPYPGGVTQHIYYLDKHFRELGHQVKIIAPCAGEDPEQLPDNVVVTTTRVISIPFSGSKARIPYSPAVNWRV